MTTEPPGGALQSAHAIDHALAPSLDDFARLADQAVQGLPTAFRELAVDVIFRIEDFASDEVLGELEITDPFELTGLYHGVDLLRRSVLDAGGELGPLVYLYRRPILDEWCERGDIRLVDLITHVLVHEIGHHFGLSDDDIDRIENEAD
jgi:predicted Zn-dependent protease with MMP-like domain